MINRERLKDGSFAPIHGGTHTRLYRVWCAMKERCGNPNCRSYKHYGAKGISVCDEWATDFASFRSWAMANGYADDLTIDRIDCKGNYEPGNCRFVTTAVQNRNYSRNRFVTYNGQTKCVADWADEFGLNRATVLWRINAGKDLDDVFSATDWRKKRWKKTTFCF